MPILRWIFQTESWIPQSSKARRQATTCWYTLSTSVPSKSRITPPAFSMPSIGVLMALSCPRRGKLAVV